MTDIYINKEVEEKFNKIEKSTWGEIDKILTEMQKGKLSDDRKIPSTDLFAKKIGKKFLIYSRKNDNIYLIDIMDEDEFNKEFTKSLLLL
jgi:hypothetical protein